MNLTLDVATAEVDAQDLAILETARNNCFSNPDTYRDLPSLGNRWESFRQTMADRIRQFTCCREAIDFAQTQGNFDHRLPLPASMLPAVNIWINTLKYEYPRYADKIRKICDTPHSCRESLLQITIGNGEISLASNIVYFHASYLLSVLSYDASVNSVCEIGGGYGGPARLWMNNPFKSIDRYCIVDLPESLFFAEVFLRKSLPGVALRYVTGAAVSDRPGERVITLCPVQRHERTRGLAFDAVINTGSMQEMTDEWIDFWSGWLDRQSARLFYSHNYVGNPVDRLFEGRNLMAPRVSGQWTLSSVRAMHPMIMLQSEERRAAELIFSRSAGSVDRAEKAHACLTAIQDTKLTLQAYCLIMHNLIQGGRVADKVGFIKKIRSDWGYDPVELLFLLLNLTHEKGFGSLNAPARNELLALKHDLKARLLASFPKGTHSV